MARGHYIIHRQDSMKPTEVEECKRDAKPVSHFFKNHFQNIFAKIDTKKPLYL